MHAARQFADFFNKKFSVKKELVADDRALRLPEHQPLPDLLVDQGTADNFLDSQLKTNLLDEACRKVDMRAEIRMQEGYDHSYYFISTFMADHLRWHAERLA